jgi:hypothetical protein
MCLPRGGLQRRYLECTSSCSRTIPSPSSLLLISTGLILGLIHLSSTNESVLIWLYKKRPLLRPFCHYRLNPKRCASTHTHGARNEEGHYFQIDFCPPRVAAAREWPKRSITYLPSTLSALVIFVKSSVIKLGIIAITNCR